MPFRYSDRHQDSLRDVVKGDNAEQLRTLLENRDQQIERFVDELERTSITRGALADRPATGDYVGQLFYDLTSDYYWKWTANGWRLLLGSGTYTPALTNMAIGTGGGAANTATWTYVFGTIRIEGTLTFGTAGTTFPAAAVETFGAPSGFTFATVAATPVGLASIISAGVITRGEVRIESGTTFRILSWNAAGASLTAVDLAAGVPGVWAAGDGFRYSFDAQVVTT